MRPTLVTGAAGFIGSHLCEALLRRGGPVRAVDSLAPHYSRELKELNIAGLAPNADFSFHEMDLATAPFGELLDGVGCVFHLAARPGVRDSWESFDDYTHSNIVATKALLDACAERAVRVVYASSSSVYGDASELPVTETAPREPISPYGASKVMVEVMAGAYHRARGLDAVGLRYFTVYGPRQRPDMGLARFIEAAVARRNISIYGDGRQKRDFTYVGDVVAATVAAAELGRAGSVYNVASNNPLPLLNVLECLGEVLGQKLALTFEPPQIGDVRDTWGAIDFAREDLGYAPSASLRDGLTAQVAEAERRRHIPVA